MNINGKTQLFAIIGNPVSHSLSPAMHNAAFAELGINGAYVPIRATNIQQTIAGLRTLGFVGASITVPFKETVMDCLDHIDPTALKIGAVNTLSFHPTNQENVSTCNGYNTDWIGSNSALSQVINPDGATALVIGAGGAAKAVVFGLLTAGAKVTIANRTQKKAETLAAELGCDSVPLDNIATIPADILINTTTVGMSPHSDRSPVPIALLPNYQVVMDIVYAPLQTTLLKQAMACGCKVIDGLDMLLYQGVEQFRIWTGVKPPPSIMRKALLKTMESM